MDSEPNQTTTDDIEDNLAERISNTSQHSDENGNLESKFEIILLSELFKKKKRFIDHKVLYTFYY